MKRKNIVILISVLLFVIFSLAVMAYYVINEVFYTGTGSGSYYAYDGYAMPQMSEGYDEDFSVGGQRNSVQDSSYAPESSPEMETNQERLIIKTGNLSLVVKDVKEAIDKISTFTLENNGFVVRSSVSKSSLAPSGSITIRIPSHIFDQGLSTLKAIGEVQKESQNGTDVTEEYIDHQSRLITLEATRDQFLKIMDQAQKIEDILAVQRELTQVQSQIEVIQGRMKYLEHSASLSTLTIDLATDKSELPVYKEDTWKPIAIAKEALRELITFGKGFISVVIWLIVFVPVWGLLVLLYYILKRKKKKVQ